MLPIQTPVIACLSNPKLRHRFVRFTAFVVDAPFPGPPRMARYRVATWQYMVPDGAPCVVLSFIEHIPVCHLMKRFRLCHYVRPFSAVQGAAVALGIRL